MKRIEYRQDENGDFRQFLIDDDLPQVGMTEDAEPNTDENSVAGMKMYFEKIKRFFVGQ